MKKWLALLCAGLWVFCACGKEKETTGGYTAISQEIAQKMMAEDEGYIIVDVRTEKEYREGHIPGAICIPNDTIRNRMPKDLPDFHQEILVYCRSGSRSKDAAQKLADLGYTNVYEFGGILTWNGEVVKEPEP